MKYFKYIDQGWNESETFKRLELTEDDYFVKYDEETGRWYTMWAVFGHQWVDAEWDLIQALMRDIQKGTLIEISESEAFIDLL